MPLALYTKFKMRLIAAINVVRRFVPMISLDKLRGVCNTEATVSKWRETVEAVVEVLTAAYLQFEERLGSDGITRVSMID